MKDKVKANQHESYGTFTVLGLLIPFVGLIVGAVFMTKDNKLDRKVGEHTVVMSVIGYVLYSLYIYSAYSSYGLQSVDFPASISFDKA